MSFTLSIIIINYKTPDITLDCLESLYSSNLKNLKTELIIIDNASKDKSIKKIKNFISKNKNPNIKPILIQNRENLGFAKANNKGIKLAQGEYILHLNSDVILEKDTIITQLKTLQKSKKYQISTCKLLLSNGKMDPACHRGFPTPWASFSYFAKLEAIFPKSKFFAQYHQGWKNLNKAHQVDVISGAFFLTTKKILEEVDYFDEDYFMYGEDIDLCFKLNKKNYKILFNPESQALHFKGQSGRKKNNKKSNRYFWQTMKLFYTKHYQDKYPKFIQAIIFKFIDYKMKS